MKNTSITKLIATFDMTYAFPLFPWNITMKNSADYWPNFISCIKLQLSFNNFCVQSGQNKPFEINDSIQFVKTEE